MDQYKLSLIIPCYNEEENIEVFYSTLVSQLSFLNCSEIIFVDDGSSDETLLKIKNIAGYEFVFCKV